MMCTSRFSSAYDLDCHFSYYHSSVKRFKCFHCDRVLYNYSGKLRHERLCSAKQSVNKKASASPSLDVNKIQDTMPLHPEESFQTESESEVIVEHNDKEECGNMENSMFVKKISEFGVCDDATESQYHYVPAPKIQRRKTFHICDIMGDVPGFSQ